MVSSSKHKIFVPFILRYPTVEVQRMLSVIPPSLYTVFYNIPWSDMPEYPPYA